MAFTAARNDDLELRGASLTWVRSPESEHRASRGFCASCGGSLFRRAPGLDRTSIAAGTLDDSSRLQVAAHIWVEQSAEWERPPDGVPANPRGYPRDATPLSWS